jgi:hypothetical protein
MDYINKVLSVVVNGCSPQFSQYVVLAARGCPIHDEIRHSAQLEQCGTDTTARANNKHFIASLDLHGPMKHLINRHVVQYQRYGFCRI